MKKIFLLVTVLSSLSACVGTSRESHFYLLSEMPQVVEHMSYERNTPLSVGIGPVEFPKYLDRSQMVLRDDGNEVRVLEFERWAEPLPENFARVISENLSSIFDSKSIVFMPLNLSRSVDYQLVMQVIRFDASENGGVKLEVLWSLRRPSGGEILPWKLSQYSKESAKEPAAQAASLSAILGDFSLELAGVLKEKL